VAGAISDSCRAVVAASSGISARRAPYGAPFLLVCIGRHSPCQALILLMPETNDQWPLPKYSTAPADHLHALGVVTLNFNTFEFALFRLFSHHLERLAIDIRVSWNLYSALQDSQKAHAIRDMYAVYEPNPIVIDHVAHILAFFFSVSE
jgi:hypothetical protein